MKANEIRKLKESGKSEFEIYSNLAGELSLFDVAFYGHKGKPGERKKLRYHWLTICKVFYPDAFEPGTLRLKYYAKKENLIHRNYNF